MRKVLEYDSETSTMHRREIKIKIKLKLLMLQSHHFILVGFFLFCGCATVPIEPNSSIPTAATVTTLAFEEEVSLDAANIAKEHGDYAEAMKIFEEVLKKNPVASEAFVGIGEIYVLQKEWKNALTHTSKPASAIFLEKL